MVQQKLKTSDGVHGNRLQWNEEKLLLLNDEMLLFLLVKFSYFVAMEALYTKPDNSYTVCEIGIFFHWPGRQWALII